MKKALLISITVLLFSCSETNYYQVFQASPEGGTLQEDNVVFEDNNCKVYYNLWEKGGEIGFRIYNKADYDIVINLSKTFFVLNGFAYEYFQNRTFINSTSNTVAIGASRYSNNVYNITKIESLSSSGTSIMSLEKSILTVPSHTSIIIKEYNIASNVYRNCNLYRYPDRRDNYTLKFDALTSPFIFSNLITYYTPNDTIRFENKFHVNQITNYPLSSMFKTIDTTKCGDKLNIPIEVHKNYSPYNFYIPYKYENL